MRFEGIGIKNLQFWAWRLGFNSSFFKDCAKNWPTTFCTNLHTLQQKMESDHTKSKDSHNMRSWHQQYQKTSSCSHNDCVSTIVMLFWKQHSLTLKFHLPKPSPSSDNYRCFHVMVFVISTLFFHVAKCGLHFLSWHVKVKWTFGYPFHMFNADYSSNISTHITNLAQVEHTSFTSFTRTHKKHTERDLTQLWHIGLEIFAQHKT